MIKFQKGSNKQTKLSLPFRSTRQACSTYLCLVTGNETLERKINFSGTKTQKKNLNYAESMYAQNK